MHKHKSEEFSITESVRLLVGWFRSVDSSSYLIALSGGVDSAVVARSASQFLEEGGRCQITLVTGTGPSVSKRDLDDAARIADLVGLPHIDLQTQEMQDEEYLRNDGRRCYHCKKNLFAAMQMLEEYADQNDAVLLTGTNADDLGDYRPGLQAAKEVSVRAPLAELGFGKSEVYQLAKWWELPVSSKPASPCLASRLAYGVEVTEERLARVEKAEELLRENGFPDCRVRVHPGEMARIEVPVDSLPRFSEQNLGRAIADQLRQFGFQFVTLDLEGFRSGNLNQLVQIESH